MLTELLELFEESEGSITLEDLRRAWEKTRCSRRSERRHINDEAPSGAKGTTS